MAGGQLGAEEVTDSAARIHWLSTALAQELVPKALHAFYKRTSSVLLLSMALHRHQRSLSWSRL